MTKGLPFFLFAALMIVALGTCGCGGEGEISELPGDSEDIRQVASSAAGAVTRVYLGKGSDGVTYQIGGDPVSHAELMAKIEDTAKRSPDAVLSVIRTVGVSSDEANLLASQIRAKGISRVNVVSVGE